MNHDEGHVDECGCGHDHGSAGFTENSTLNEAVSRDNGVAILVKHGVPCPTCPMASMEMDQLNLGMICSTYGLDIDALLKELNA